MKIRVLLVLVGMTMSCAGLIIKKDDGAAELLNVTIDEKKIQAEKSSIVTTVKTTEILLKNKQIAVRPENITKELPHGFSMPFSLFDDVKGPHLVSLNNNSSKTAEKLKNIVLLLVDDKINTWEKLLPKSSYSIHGHFKNCPVHTSSNDSSLPITNDTCQCEKNLKTNINKLLSWAQFTHGMNTATVLGGNFSLSSFLDLANRLPPPIALNNKIEELGQSVIPEKSHSHLPIPNQGLWDWLDIISRMRLAFFKHLIDSLHQNASARLDPSHTEQKTSPEVTLQPIGLANLISSTLADLKISNDHGYLLITVAPSDQVNSILQVVQHETSKKDTLIVISGLCSDNGNKIPFFASGPRSISIHRTKSIIELPNVIQSVVDECKKNCKERRASLTLPSEALVPKKRFARSDDDDDQSFIDETNGDPNEATSSSESTTEIPENSSTEEEFIVIRADPEASRRSAARQLHEKQLIIIFGFVISIITTLIFYP